MASLSRDERTGHFYAQFYNRAKSPSRKTIPLRTKTRRTAQRALLKLENAVALGELDPWTTDGDPVEQLGTVGAAVDAYLASRSHLKATTLRTYRDILFPFQRHVGSMYTVSNITVPDILAWLDSTSAGDVTRRKYVNHLGYFFRFLLKRGEISSDLSKKVPLRKVPETAPKAMTVEELDWLLRTIRTYSRDSARTGSRKEFNWFAVLVEANVFLGLRRGELIHLRWEHVDFERDLVLVKNSDEFTTKSSRERTIPLCGQARKALKQLSGLRLGQYVFHVDGQKLKPGTLTKIFLKFRRMAGLPEHINLHSTRHTFGTWLAERGTPVTVIQTLMGHSSVTTTERYMSTRADIAESWVKKVFDS